MCRHAQQTRELWFGESAVSPKGFKIKYVMAEMFLQVMALLSLVLA